MVEIQNATYLRYLLAKQAGGNVSGIEEKFDALIRFISRP